MATNILLLGASGFIAVGMFRLTDPILPKIAEDFGTSVGSVAATVTAFTLGYGLFQLLHGPLGVAVPGVVSCACGGEKFRITAKTPRPPRETRMSHG